MPVARPREAADYIRVGDETGTSIGVAKTAGIYPVDYRLEPCAVEDELAEGDRVTIGDVELECVDTPGLRIDALFPGHFAFSLRDGQRHVERAKEVLDQLLIPPQAVSAW